MKNHSFISCEDARDHYVPYVIALTDRARELRRHQTQAETIFWEAVRRKQFYGLKFVRQKPLLGFIADFYCARLKLVIELDGNIHDETQEYDGIRSEQLKSFGITVIRYTNDDVVNNLGGVLFDLLTRIKKSGRALPSGSDFTPGSDLPSGSDFTPGSDLPSPPGEGPGEGRHKKEPPPNV